MSHPNTHPLLLRGASVVGPRGVTADAGLLLEGERIARVYGPGDAAGAPPGVILDVSGLTLYPGFIDLHIHARSALTL